MILSTILSSLKLPFRAGGVMRFIKLAIISFIVLFLLLTTLGLMLPSTVYVTRNITIRASSSTLRYYISDINNWPLWMESIEAKSLSFTSPQTKGQGVSVQMGTLSVRIVKDGKDTEESIWTSPSGKEQHCVFQIQSDSAISITHLNWYFEQKLHWYPWERLPAIANDKVMDLLWSKALTS